MSDLLLKPALPGIALRRWRLLHRVKQTHAAQLFNVTQSTISRWESGVQAMEPAAQLQLERLLTARLDSAADQVLARLIGESQRPMHLICDLTHRLLAASPRRFTEWTADASDLRGTSLWRFATDEIQQAESRLGDLGWYDEGTTELRFWTSDNHDPMVRIVPGILVWERLTLSDGTLARLVTTAA